MYGNVWKRSYFWPACVGFWFEAPFSGTTELLCKRTKWRKSVRNLLDFFLKNYCFGSERRWHIVINSVGIKHFLYVDCFRKQLMAETLIRFNVSLFQLAEGFLPITRAKMIIRTDAIENSRIVFKFYHDDKHSSRWHLKDLDQQCNTHPNFQTFTVRNGMRSAFCKESFNQLK